MNNQDNIEISKGETKGSARGVGEIISEILTGSGLVTIALASPEYAGWVIIATVVMYGAKLAARHFERK